MTEKRCESIVFIFSIFDYPERGSRDQFLHMKKLSFCLLFAVFWIAWQGAVFNALAQEKDDEFDPFADGAEKALDKLTGSESEASNVEFLEPGMAVKLSRQVQPSLVVVRVKSRDGSTRSTGSGFIITDTGLIVTNRHVIGEGRPVEVEFHDGNIRKVTEINASDRLTDLAVIRVDPRGLHLKPLPLGDSDKLVQGQIIVGFGNPRGLEFSVVPGLVSAIRKLDVEFLGEGVEMPIPMIQLAMPIEMGNSGGPVVNLAGEAVGIVTLKHRVTENLGYAVRSNDLQPLLDKPNPIPMSRWMTVGALDKREWKPIMGGSWSQRGGVVFAEGMGKGFGGRTLCLSEETVPELPYEIAVQVKLDGEGGAAGLAFSSDGNEKHYGFYPSEGRLRLTRFEGPDVYSWTILDQVTVPGYKPGEWNKLRIRVEKETITGYVNGEKAIELEDSDLRGGKVGLCKFRTTEAEFRGFHIGHDLSEKKASPKEREKLAGVINDFAVGKSDEKKAITKLGEDVSTSRLLLDKKISELQKTAESVRKLKRELYRDEVIGELLQELKKPEHEIDLFEVGIQIARIDDDVLDVGHYRDVFDRLVTDAAVYIGAKKGKLTQKQKVEALRDFFFKENGFHGSRGNYYHRANSYLNYVLDDREGLPITLSLLFIESARRLKLNGVAGISLPGHFVTGYWEGGAGGKRKIPTTIFDAFDGGKEIMSRELRLASQDTNLAKALEAASARDIAVRILRNLVGIKIDQKRNPVGALDYLEVMLAMEPELAQERFQRALIRYQTGNVTGAIGDLDWLLDRRPDGIDYGRLKQFRDSLPLRKPGKSDG